MGEPLRYSEFHGPMKLGVHWGRTVRCARAVRALCEKLAVLHHREFGKSRRLEGCHWMAAAVDGAIGGRI